MPMKGTQMPGGVVEVMLGKNTKDVAEYVRHKAQTTTRSKKTKQMRDKHVKANPPKRDMSKGY